MEGLNENIIGDEERTPKMAIRDLEEQEQTRSKISMVQFKLALIFFPNEKSPNDAMMRWSGLPIQNLDENGVQIVDDKYYKDMAETRPEKSYSNVFREYLDSNPEILEKIKNNDEKVLDEIREYLDSVKPSVN
ncbi:MAG: hypothetical protein AAB840_01375 [Patescibacteria group bacterium]